MNIRCNIRGGGLFSKILLAIQHIEEKIKALDEIENIFFYSTDKRILKKINPFDYVYSQIDLEPSHIIECIEHPNNIIYTNDIPQNKLNRFKIINKKLSIIDNIKLKIKKNKINQDYLGVHIRLTDMNKTHSNYGVFDINDFIDKMNLELNNYDKVFIASDNYEAISKLKQIYGKKIFYYKDCIRPKKMNSDFITFQKEEWSSPDRMSKMWQDSFIDTMLLSQCTTFIHRASSLANMVKIQSNTINKVITL